MKLQKLPQAGRVPENVAELIETLIGTEQRLVELTDGEVDTVSGQDGRAFLLRSAQEQLRDSDAVKQAAILNALPAHIALLDAQGVIVSVNEAWRQFADCDVLHAPGHVVGFNYLAVCDRARGGNCSEGQNVAEGIRAVLSGQEKNFSMEYPCHTSSGKRWFQLTVTPLSNDQMKGAVIMHLDISARRRAAEALDELSQKTERRERILNTALSCMSDFAQIRDRNGCLLFANQPLLNLWGRTLEEVIGKNFFDLGYPAEMAAKLQRQVWEVFETRQSITDETPYVSPTEVDRFYEYIFSPVFAADRTVDFVVSSTRDITERKRASALLMESQGRLTLATESAHVGIWEWNVLTNDLAWDAQMCALYGIRMRDFSGSYEAWQTRLHPDDRKRCETEICAAVDGTGGFHTEFRVIHPNGEIRDIEAHGIMHRAADGSAARMIGVNWDITARKQAEHKVGEQANLLNLTHDAIMVRDMDDRIEFWSHGAELLYGWTAAEVCGRPSRDFLYQETQADFLEAQRTFLGEGLWSGECRHLTKKGSTVIVRCRWTLVRDEHGQPKSKMVINTDVTEQKKIEEQFLRAQRLESIGTLASGVAHDLNNVLVPIMMAAPVLRGAMDAAEREKFLDIVETSAQRGADIVRQVLTFARGADGDRTLLQPIYLLEEVYKIAWQTFPKSIVIRTSHQEDTRLLEGDSTQLHQVLLNLCINARDAMPDGGELRLSVENFDVDERYASIIPDATAGPHVMLQVTDNGSGIPKEVLEKIYDPFFTTKVLGHGTGLGLSTVAGIVKSHGGFIQVYSESGQTTFKVFLPAQPTAGASGVVVGELPVPRGEGETILLVDDEPSIREIAEIILTEHGYKVIAAADGPTAVAIFARKLGNIDVVVTDLAMPVMGGLMLARTLRQIEPDLKVILSTGGADDAHTAEIAALNVDGFLTKPYAGRSLLLKIDEVLHRPLHLAA